MNKKDYMEAIERIVPPDNVKEEAREKIFRKEITKTSVKTSNRKLLSYRKVAVASLVIICVAGVSVPVVASGIQSLILSRTPSYAPLTGVIETCVYSQSDGHIQVSVEELLSDGVVVNMTVKYTAFDKVGKEWLEQFELVQNNICLKPYMINTKEYGTNYGYSTEELNDRASENERVFILELKSSSRDYSKAKGVFSFPLTESCEEVLLDISGNVEIRSFKLQSQEVASEYYTPTYIEISPMSFVIYAKNHGVFKRVEIGEYSKEIWLLPDEEIESLESKSYFIMKDGSKELLAPSAHNTTYPKPENLYSDVMLYSDNFNDYSESYSGVPKLMNLDDFEAIVINGARFELVQ